MAVRVRVVTRQLAETNPKDAVHVIAMTGCPYKLQLQHGLERLFQGRKSELHHRPALENRQFNKRTRKYDPDANDPDYLVYLENNETSNDHYIETHVRGVGAQRSDTGQRNHQKALDRNRGLIKRRRPKAKIRSRGFQKPPPGKKWWRGTNRGPKQRWRTR